MTVITIGSLVLILYYRWQSPHPEEWYFKCDFYSTLLHHFVRQATSGKDKWILYHKTTFILLFSHYICVLGLEQLCLDSFIFFTLALLKHFTCDTNPQNGFVHWSLHSSSPFHSNKTNIFQSSQLSYQSTKYQKKKKEELHSPIS